VAHNLAEHGVLVNRIKEFLLSVYFAGRVKETDSVAVIDVADGVKIRMGLDGLSVWGCKRFPVIKNIRVRGRRSVPPKDDDFLWSNEI